MKPSEKNKVLAQAWKDYNPEIVKINEEKVMNAHFSEEQKQLLAHNEIEALKGKTLAQCNQFLLGLNSINYQFWDMKDGVFTRYINKGKVGALGSFEGFVSFYEELEKNNFNIDLINEDFLTKHFGEIPDKSRRIDILKESMNKEVADKVYDVILDHIKTDAVNVDLADKIAKIMPISFEDPYLKKIQLSLYEYAQILNDHGYNVECDITVAADYQVPKVCEGEGYIEYSEDLKKMIDNYQIIEPDSVEEKALRAATILVCEQLSHVHKISIPALDRDLWLRRNNYKKNFHLTKTSNY